MRGHLFKLHTPVRIRIIFGATLAPLRGVGDAPLKAQGAHALLDTGEQEECI